MNTYSVPVSVKGVVFENDKVWLRKNERDEWELPGGKLDKGEQPIETVKRELNEELGFTISVVGIVHAYVYTVKHSGGEGEGVLVITYLCKIEEKTQKFETEGEAGSAQFASFSQEEIRLLPMPQFYKEAIKNAWEANML